MAKVKITGKEEEVLRLRATGVTEREIMKRTGLKKSKVHDLCAKAGIAPAPKNRKGAERTAIAKKPSAGVLRSPKGSKKDPLPSAEEKEVFEDHGNEAEAELVTHDVRTLEDLLEVCKVDLSVWAVERYVTNKWACAMKDNAGEAKTIPLYQVKAWLIRKVALANPEMPPVAPIHISFIGRRSTPVQPVDSKDNMRRAVVLPDMQVGFRRDVQTNRLVPFHDRKAMDIALQIIRHTRPDRIVMNGDNLDLPDYSDKFLISPEFYFTTQPSVVELAWFYAQIRQICPNAQIDVIEGNHDFRFLKSVIRNFQAIYAVRPANDLEGAPLMSMERLLGLDDLGINYHGNYPSGEVWLGDDIRVHHGEVVRGGSGRTVAKVSEDLRSTEIFGHIHKQESATKTMFSKKGAKTYQAWSFGTLASIQPGVVPSSASRNNWQNGLGVVDYSDAHSSYGITGILIFGDRAVFERRLFIARSEREIVAQIESETKFDLRSI